MKIQGFSLLELLVATFIFAFGLLGLLEIYSRSWQRVMDSYLRTLAVSQLIAATEEHNDFIFDYSKRQQECSRLLPHGKLHSNKQETKICWQSQLKQHCLTW